MNLDTENNRRKIEKSPVITSAMLRKLRGIEKNCELRLFDVQIRIKDEVERLEKRNKYREWKEGLKIKHDCKKCGKPSVVLTDGECPRCMREKRK